MDKRISQRKSGKFIAAAIASVGLAGLGASQADAGLVVDLRATAISGTGSIGAGGKTVTAGVGSTVTLDIFARISGTNATQNVGAFDGFAGANDTRNDDSLQILVASFNSTGLLKGNFNPSPDNGTTGPQTPAFNGGGSTNGVVQDWDSDGDLHIGNGATTDPTSMFSARGAFANFPTFMKNTFLPAGGFGLTPGFNFDPLNSIIDATTGEAHVGELVWVVTGSTGSATLNYVPRAGTDGGTALWFEDASPTTKTPGSGSFSVLPGVVVSPIPEPTTLGLLGIASLGLLARRRKD